MSEFLNLSCQVVLALNSMDVVYEVSVTSQMFLSEVISSIPDDGRDAIIHLMPGDYHQRVEIFRPHTSLVGAGADRTVIHEACGALEILSDTGNQGMKRGTFRTSIVRTDADHVTLQGLTIRNDAAPREKAGQAIALYADGDSFFCEDCVLSSFQDTLFTAPLPPSEVEKNGFIGPKQYAPRTPQRHLYRRVSISGDVDFIFGGAAAFFEDCDIITRDGREMKESAFEGYCTAASTPEGQKFGYVFHQCRFRGDGLPQHTTYLGRPWREFAKVALIYCTFDDHIHPALFDDWGKTAFHEHGMFAVYPMPESVSGTEGALMPDVRILTQTEAEEYTLDALWKSM